MKYFIVLLFSVAAFAGDPEISVQGNCEIKVTPDRGAITFTAENQARDQKDAVKKTTEQVNQLKEEIKKLNLADIELKNTNYNVFPVREYEKEKIVDKGVRATLSLEVTTSEIARIGEAMQAAAKVGVINVGSLTTFLSLEKSQKEYLKCLDVAADDARGKAQQLAKKLGFKLGDVIKLNEVPQISPPVPVMERAMMKSMDAAPAQIEPGTQQYSTNIQVTFKIK